MINVMIGPPGGGKSYETVVFHILPALEEGRKVITNVSLNVDEICLIEPRARTLLDIRPPLNSLGTRTFSDVSDYSDTWRHPTTNRGPLYVIDEAHKAIPRRGLSPKPEQTLVDEWYAESRHEGADVLLLTQSYGKLSKAITDQVQVCYRVKKMTVFGNPHKYIRKVQEGVRGEVMSEAERTYEPKYFKLYKSHTKTAAAVVESDAQDIKPAHLIFKRAGLITTACGLGIAACTAMVTGKDEQHPKTPVAAAARTKEHGTRPLPASSPAQPATNPTAQATQQVEAKPIAAAPFDGLTIHIKGVMRHKAKALYLFALSQNGQVVSELTSVDLEKSGYTIKDTGDCAALITYEETAASSYARCDLPKVQPVTPAVTS